MNSQHAAPQHVAMNPQSCPSGQVVINLRPDMQVCGAIEGERTKPKVRHFRRKNFTSRFERVASFLASTPSAHMPKDTSQRA